MKSRNLESLYKAFISKNSQELLIRLLLARSRAYPSQAYITLRFFYQFTARVWIDSNMTHGPQLEKQQMKLKYLCCHMYCMLRPNLKKSCEKHN